MSNYPPGVTGFEPQIAGSHEADDRMEVGQCEQLGEVVIERLSPRRVRGLVCTFEEGEVDGMIYDHVLFVWECPSCRTENELEIDPPEPPEYDRDSWDGGDDWGWV